METPEMDTTNFEIFLKTLDSLNESEFTSHIENWRSNHIKQLVTLANVSSKRGLHDIAVNLFELSLSQEDIASTSDCMHYSKSLEMVGRTCDQYSFLLNQSKVSPSSHRIWKALGNTQKKIGLLEESIKSHLKALEINYKDLDLLYSYSTLQKFLDAPTKWIRYIENIFTEKTQKPARRCLAGFILGQMEFDISNFKKAFNYIDSANKIYLENYEARLELDENYKDLLVSNFTTDYYDTNEVSKIKSGIIAEQIFIIGMSRSGKTIIENILQTSDKVTPQRETLAISKFIRSELKQRPKAKMTEYLNSLNKEKLLKIQEKYAKEFSNNKIQTYTYPWNIFFLGYIGLFNPKAKIIFADRNHMDLGLACYLKYYGKGNGYASDLTILGHQIAIYEELVNYWHKTLPNPCMRINYDDLVKAPLEISKNIFDFCEIKHSEEQFQYKYHHASKTKNNTYQSLNYLTHITDRHIGFSKVLANELTSLSESYLRHFQKQ